jgi:nucleotide-binding universal stress UspA family protein
MTHPAATTGGRFFDAEILRQSGAVLVALKPGTGGDSTLAVARWLAGKTASELHVLSVVESADPAAVAAGDSSFPPEHLLRERGEAAMRQRVHAAACTHGDADCRLDVLEGAASVAITHTARDRGASVIVVGTGRHALLGRFLYGERALEVVRDAVGLVLVVPPVVRPPFVHAMVAVDFSQASMRAAVSALGMLGAGGTLSLVHVKSAVRLSEENAGWWNDAYERRSREMLSRFVDALSVPAGVTIDHALLRGEAVESLLRFAHERDVDLVVCGRRRHSLVERVLVGSVSSALVRRAPCSVLVAPERPYDRKLDDTSWMTGVVVSRNPEEWSGLLRGVSQRNAGRRAQLVVEPKVSAAVERLNGGYGFLAADYDRDDGRASIVLDGAAAAGSRVSHRIADLREVEMTSDSEGKDTRLQFDTSSGRCILTFMDAP